MKYALLVYQTTERFEDRSPDTIAAGTAYGQALQAAGIFIGGAGLASPKVTKTVNLREGKREIHDGPYAETKELLGGFAIIDAPDLATALDWAARHPAAAHGQVEVRPITGCYFVPSK